MIEIVPFARAPSGAVYWPGKPLTADDVFVAAKVARDWAESRSGYTPIGWVPARDFMPLFQRDMGSKVFSNEVWRKWLEDTIFPLKNFVSLDETCASPAKAKPRREPDHAPFYWDLPAVTCDNKTKLGEDYMAAVRAMAGDKR